MERNTTHADMVCPRPQCGRRDRVEYRAGGLVVIGYGAALTRSRLVRNRAVVAWWESRTSSSWVLPSVGGQTAVWATGSSSLWVLSIVYVWWWCMQAAERELDIVHGGLVEVDSDGSGEAPDRGRNGTCAQCRKVKGGGRRDGAWLEVVDERLGGSAS
jgi:hypothetical protein